MYLSSTCIFLSIYLGNPNESFVLSRYKEEVGKSYNRITLYLAKKGDLLLAEEMFMKRKRKGTPTIDELIAAQERTSDATTNRPINNLSANLSTTNIVTSSHSAIEINRPNISHSATEINRPNISHSVTEINQPNIGHSATTTTSQPIVCNSATTTNQPGTTTCTSNFEGDRLSTLKDIFPGTSPTVLQHAIFCTENLEEAVQLLIMHSNTPVYDSYTSICDIDSGSDEDDDIIVIGEDDLAETEITMVSNDVFASDPNLQNILSQWAGEKLQSDKYMRMKVRRNKIWSDTCLKLDACTEEDLTKQLKVQFVGEPAVDQGGPKREFFTLINREATTHLLSGCSGIFRHNVLALNDKEFFKFGQLTALGLLQGSSGPRCFTQSVADFIIYGNTDSLSPSIEEIPVDKVKEKMQRLKATEDKDEFRRIASFECDFRFDCGYSKPIINLEDKELFFKCTSLHYTILASLKELEQYIDGLKTCDLLTLIRKHPAAFKPVFQISDTLTAEVLDEMFLPQLSPMGSNKRVQEEALVFNFGQLLEDTEKGHVKEEVDGQEVIIKLQDILMFVTGAESIPAIGFSPQPTIEFQHGFGASRKLSANTCGNVLKLPVSEKMTNYTNFKSEFIFCMLNSPGFGNV